jgi:hypothetical protein
MAKPKAKPKTRKQTEQEAEAAFVPAPILTTGEPPRLCEGDFRGGERVASGPPPPDKAAAKLGVTELERIKGRPE